LPPEVPEPEDITAEQFARWWKETGERELRQVLFWRWDPIGVADYFPNTVGEYDDYPPGIAALLRLGVNAEGVGEHLEFLEREPMGLAAPDPDRCGRTAGLLVEWYANSVASWLRFGPS
jgi:hypothetical protein